MKKIAIFAFVAMFVLAGCSLGSSGPKNLTADEAKAKALEFINSELMQPGSEATIDSVAEENGLYKLSVNIGQGDNIDSYLTKDGSKFFPQALETDASLKDGEEAAASEPVAEAPKSDKPVVELFVMSHCPYGTQIEKGILPVLDTLGDKIDFQLKFCDYAMHDKKEMDEQLVQYCIMKEQGDRFNTYLSCFLEDDDSARCLTANNVDKSKLDSCVAAADKEFAVSEGYADKTTWKGSFPTFNVHKADNEKYGVGGSPTLIINGAEISSGRSPSVLLATICGAFNEAPEECATELSTANPSPGFGYGEGGPATAATCN